MRRLTCPIATLILLTLACGFQAIAQTQAPYFHWARSVSGAGDDVGNGIGADRARNSYVTGCYKSTNLTFGLNVLTNAGGAEIFLAKYDAAGNVLWAKRAGGAGDDFGNAVAVDAAGNSFVTGFFFSTNVSFGGLPVTNRGSAD